MVKRELSKEERLLWKLYTKDVKRTSKEKDFIFSHDDQNGFNIKVPRRKIFNKKIEPVITFNESLKDKDSNWSKKLKQNKVKIEGKIDLHGMTCVEAHEKLYRYIERAQKNGKRVVLVVTGKGGIKKDYADFRYDAFQSTRGVLRREVPLWLSSGAMRHMIVSFQDALQKDGGIGALYVVIKRLT